MYIAWYNHPQSSCPMGTYWVFHNVSSSGSLWRRWINLIAWSWRPIFETFGSDAPRWRLYQRYSSYDKSSSANITNILQIVWKRSATVGMLAQVLMPCMATVDLLAQAVWRRLSLCSRRTGFDHSRIWPGSQLTWQRKYWYLISDSKGNLIHSLSNN